MKKYISRATKPLAIISLICGVVFLIDLILILAKVPNVSVVRVAFSGFLNIFFLCLFLAERRGSLIIDNKKIIFPPGVTKNGKTVFHKTIIKFCEMISIDIDFHKGDGLISADTYFYTIKLKDGSNFIFTLFAFGKSAEKEIFNTIKNNINNID